MAQDPTSKPADALVQAEHEVLQQIGQKQAASGAVQSGSSKEIGRGGTVNIEIKGSFQLDDARIFDLNGGGLTIAAIASN